MELNRTAEQWQKCDPKAMAKMSEAAIMYALADARSDVLRMHSEIERLTTAGLEAADLLRQEAAILRDCYTIGGEWDEDDLETQAHYDQMLALADRLTPSNA